MNSHYQSSKKIFEAVRSGNVRTAKRLLTLRQFHVNYSDYYYGTVPMKISLLHVAAESGKLNMITFLLNNGANINWRCSETDDTPIFLSCLCNHFNAVRLLIEKGADINIIADFYGCKNVLTVACKLKHFEIAKLLLLNNANVFFDEDQISTPLHFACNNNNLEITKMLIERGANYYARDEKNRTPIWLTDSVQIVNFILIECLNRKYNWLLQNWWQKQNQQLDIDESNTELDIE